jgi:hypothetical protein
VGQRESNLKCPRHLLTRHKLSFREGTSITFISKIP